MNRTLIVTGVAGTGKAAWARAREVA